MVEYYKKILQELELGNVLLEEDTPSKPPHDYNPYFWWRRFGTHKNLSSKNTALEKAQNGDFDPSPYWKQINYEYYWLAQDVVELRDKLGYVDKFKERELIQNYNRRIKKLTQDALLDEDARMEDLYSSIARDYKVTKKQVREYIQNKAFGTIKECILNFNKNEMDLVR